MDNNTTQIEQVNEQKGEQKTHKKSIKMSIKTAIIIVVIIAVGALAYVYKGLFIAPTVNGSPISRLAVIQELEKSSGKKLLDSLITEKLIQDETNAKNITVSDEEINGEIKKIEDQIAAQGTTLASALAEQGMSMDDLTTQIIIQNAG